MEIKKMTEDVIGNMIREHRELNPEREVSETVIRSLKLYAERGISPGGFLTAVLCNDLFGALGRADSYNRASIFQITQYIYNCLPSDCWGSREEVSAWVERFVSKE